MPHGILRLLVRRGELDVLLPLPVQIGAPVQVYIQLFNRSEKGAIVFTRSA